MLTGLDSVEEYNSMKEIYTSYSVHYGLKLVKAKLMPVNPDKKLTQGEGHVLTATNASAAEFYLNPESWNEEKSANWVKHDIPGLSDPIQQWISSGPRTIKFQALVTKDTSQNTANFEQKGSISTDSSGGSITTRLAPIAAKLTENTNEITQNAANESTILDLGITNKLNFYRSLVYPRIYAKGGRVLPPYPVRLLAGTTFGDRTNNALFVVDSVEIQITKQLPTLVPIEAIVSFTLTELVDSTLSSDTNIFTGYSNG